MKSQVSLSPQDIVVLLKIASLNGQDWFQKSLADSLALSQSEISKSLSRSNFAGLLGGSGKEVHKQALLEFLQFGIRYVFPVRPGPLMRGIPTSHSASPLNQIIISNEAYVWPSAKVLLEVQQLFHFMTMLSKRLSETLFCMNSLRSSMR